MQPITEDEILSRDEYERRRPEIRRRLLDLKSKRRVPLGGNATVHFETRETMVYQVHEMLRAEDSWRRPGAIADELAAYNPLVPSGRDLKATLMLEYSTPEERTRRLQQLLGIDRHLWLEVGDSEPVLASFDQAQVSPTRVSSVQYVVWPIDDERARMLRAEGAVVRIRLDHPEYRALAVLGEETRREIAGDLD